MRIWSIQNIGAWEYLQRRGRLEAGPEHRADNWPHTYDWMREQLVRRVGPPPGADSQPLWSFVQWISAAKKRPDLRALRHSWGAADGAVQVMIECELPDDDVLLSDHDAWHIPLNDSYLSLDEGEADAHRSRRRFYERVIAKEKLEAFLSPRLERLKQDRQKSWELIFDLEALSVEDWGLMHQKSIQACFWQIRLDQVKSCKPFRVKQRKR